MSSGHIRQDRKASVTITFASPADAVEWLSQASDLGAIQSDARLYQTDGLDELVGDKGTPEANRFIVRRDGDRPRGKVRLEETNRTPTAVAD